MSFAESGKHLPTIAGAASELESSTNKRQELTHPIFLACCVSAILIDPTVSGGGIPQGTVVPPKCRPRVCGFGSGRQLSPCDRLARVESWDLRPVFRFLTEDIRFSASPVHETVTSRHGTVPVSTSWHVRFKPTWVSNPQTLPPSNPSPSTLNSKPSTLKPSNPQTLKPSNPRTLKPSNPQTLKPSNPQTLKPSNPQTLKPSNPQTLKPSNSQTLIPRRAHQPRLKLACRGVSSR